MWRFPCCVVNMRTNACSTFCQRTILQGENFLHHTFIGVGFLIQPPIVFWSLPVHSASPSFRTPNMSVVQTLLRKLLTFIREKITIGPTFSVLEQQRTSGFPLWPKKGEKAKTFSSFYKRSCPTAKTFSSFFLFTCTSKLSSYTEYNFKVFLNATKFYFAFFQVIGVA